MKQKANRLVAPILVLCLTAASSHAATIVYNFTGANTGTVANTGSVGVSRTFAATSNDFTLGVTTSNWTLTSPAASSATIIGIQTPTVGAAAAIGAAARVSKRPSNATHTFSVTIPPAASATFTNIAFRYGSFGADTSVTTPNLLNLSFTNGGSVASPNIVQAVAGSNSAFQFTDYSLALSGLVNETGTTITFTFADVSQGNNNNFENQFTYIDNITLTGTVVPEPRAALIGGLGLLMLLRRRR